MHDTHTPASASHQSDSALTPSAFEGQGGASMAPPPFQLMASPVVQCAGLGEAPPVLGGSRLKRQHLRTWNGEIDVLMTNSRLRSNDPPSSKKLDFATAHPQVSGAMDAVENYRDKQNPGRVNSVMLHTDQEFEKLFLAANKNKEYDEATHFPVPNVHFLTVFNGENKGGYTIDKGTAKVGLKNHTFNHLEGFEGFTERPDDNKLLWKKKDEPAAENDSDEDFGMEGLF